MWIFEVVSLRIDIDNYLAPMWHICSYKFQFAWMPLLIISWILYMRVFLGMCFLIFRSLYSHGNHLLQVTLITMIVWLLEATKNLFRSIKLNLYTLLHPSLCEYDLGYPYELPREDYSQFFLSMDNYYQIYGRLYWSYSLWPLLNIVLSLAK